MANRAWWAAAGLVVVLAIGAVALGVRPRHKVARPPPGRVLQTAKVPGKNQPVNRPAAPPAHPNVLLLLLDTVRADRMSLYGHDRPTTPNLERLAKSGLVYENAVAPGNWTVPTHASLFTGLPTRTHGTNAEWTWLDARHVTLAEWLGEHGYDTFLFSPNVYVQPHTNLTQGFAEQRFAWEPPIKALAARATEEKLLPNDASTEISPAWTNPYAHELSWSKAVFKDAGSVANQALLDWLDDRGSERPFFAYLNYMETHSPRVPSAASRRAVMDEAQQALALKTDVSQARLMAYTLEKNIFTEEELAAVRGVYDASLRDLDALVGELLEDLHSTGVLKDTIVVVTSDHGESLGEHGHFEHRFVLYEPLVHVPLVLRYPAKVKPGRVSTPVSTASLFATLAEILALPPPSGIEPSLLDAPERPVVSEFTATPPALASRIKELYPDADLKPWFLRRTAIRAQSDKLVVDSLGQRELYDLTSDPTETQNLADTMDRDDALLGDLESWKMAHPAYDASARAPEDRPRSWEADQEALQMLRALGYLE